MHFQPAMGSIFDVECDFEGKNDQLVQPGGKHTDKKSSKKENKKKYLLFLKGSEQS